MTDPKQQVLAALDRLKAFTAWKEEASNPTLAARIFKYVNRVFSSDSRRKIRSKEMNMHVSLEIATNTLRSYHYLLQHDPELAQQAQKVIDQYNTQIAQTDILFVQAEDNLHPIEIPFSKPPAAKKIDALFYLNLPNSVPKQEHKDSLRAKTLRYLQDSLGVAKTVEALKNTAYFKMSGTTAMLSVLPGIFATADFREMGTHSILIPESFSISADSLCNGFPLPAYHTGMALHGALIPTCPRRPEHLPKNLYRLLQQQKAIRLGLTLDGPLIPKAWQIYLKKKEEFEKDREIILTLQNQWWEALFQANEESVDASISQFFEACKKANIPYETFTEVNEGLLDLFVHTPIVALQKAWVTPNHPLRHSQNKQQAALALLEKETSEALTKVQTSLSQAHSLLHTGILHYVSVAGTTLARHCQRIFLQHFSETTEISSLPLSDADLRIHMILYSQFIAYTDVFQNRQTLSIKELLQQEISILRTPNIEKISHPAAEIVAELGAYFIAQRK